MSETNELDINVGKYSENKIINLFGSPKQKEYYSNNNKITPAQRKRIIDRASRFCKLSYLGDGYYSVSKIYPYPLPAKWPLMNQSLYQYLVPLILQNLINGHDENNAITLTIGKWARELKMINHNYHLIKSNKEDAASEYGLDVDTIFDFYDKSDTAIDYYITNALSFLKSATCIYWLQVHYIVEEVTDNTNTVDENGNVTPNIHLETHIATEDEMKYYTQCMKIADKAAGITNDSERYYNKKSVVWNKVLKRELYKRNIKLVYKAYQAYYIHMDRCQFLLDQFENKSQTQLYNELSEAFTKHIVDNSENRYEKSPHKYNTSYCEQFSNLCDMVINPNTEYLGDRISYKSSIKYNLDMKGQ